MSENCLLQAMALVRLLESKTTSKNAQKTGKRKVKSLSFKFYKKRVSLNSERCFYGKGLVMNENKLL